MITSAPLVLKDPSFDLGTGFSVYKGQKAEKRFRAIHHTCLSETTGFKIFKIDMGVQRFIAKGVMTETHIFFRNGCAIDNVSKTSQLHSLMQSQFYTNDLVRFMSSEDNASHDLLHEFTIHLSE